MTTTTQGPDGELGTPIQGVTLYSFTRAFHGREVDLEGLPGDVGTDDLDVAITGDGLGPVDRLGDGAVHRSHRLIVGELLGTMGEDELGPRPRSP